MPVYVSRSVSPYFGVSIPAITILKAREICKRRFYNCISPLGLICAKNRSIKHLIFQKWDEIWQNWQWSKGYSPCKMVSLAQKLKLSKTCKIRSFYNYIRVVLRKKPLVKNTSYSKNEAILKSGKIGKWSKGYSLCKMLSLAQKLKVPKTCNVLDTVAPFTALIERREVTSRTTCRDDLNSGCFTDRIRPKISRRTNFD